MAAGVRIDPVLVVVACLALGAALVVAPVAGAVGAAVSLAALARRLGRVAAVVALLALLVGAARGHWLLAEHGRRFELARELLPAPARCAARGRVAASPVWVGERLRVDAELSGLDCEGRLDQRAWRARLYVPSQALRVVARPLPRASPARAGGGGPANAASPAPPPSAASLARGDEFSVVADLAPVSDFRNFLLPDPRPGAARRGALLSGGALSFEVERRSGGVRALVDRARGHVRGRILATFGERVSGMARALVLGENDLDPGDQAAFQRSGLSHLLAVSGTHLILAVLALLRGVEALARRVPSLSSRLDVRRPTALLGCCLAPLYADFAGGSGSAWRAAWMLCAVLGVRAAGRHVFPSRALAASLGAGWVTDGLVAFDPSFSLSMAATTGLLAFGQRLRETHVAPSSQLVEPRRPELRRLATAISRAALTTLAATLPCVPILLTLSPGLSLASVAANLLAAPIGEAVALPLCLAHALCAPLPALERGLALVASGALGLIRAIAHAAAAVEWLYFDLPPPSEWHHSALLAAVSACLAARGRPWLAASQRSSVAGLDPAHHLPAALAIGAPPALAPAPHERAPRDRAAHERALRPRRPALAHPHRRPAPATSLTRAALIGVLALVGVEAATRWQHSGARMQFEQRLRVTALDVGQGDATLVDLPDGRLMLIDGGGFVGVPVDPGERVIVPTLRARRRERIDILVLTHPHPDHYGGLAAVVRELDIGEFWYGGADAERLGDPHASDSANPMSPSPPPRGPRRAADAARAAPGSHGALLALLRERRIPMRTAASLCTNGGRVDSTLRVLHPCPSASAAPSANDASLVLRVHHGRHAALLVGDAERWAERRLLATRADALDADLLKVGHHGSRTSSSPAFLARVRPRVATISAGIRNRFGHPHPEALEALASTQTHVLRLDRVGAVRWESDGASASLATFAPEPDR